MSSVLILLTTVFTYAIPAARKRSRAVTHFTTCQRSYTLYYCIYMCDSRSPEEVEGRAADLQFVVDGKVITYHTTI